VKVSIECLLCDQSDGTAPTLSVTARRFANIIVIRLLGVVGARKVRDREVCSEKRADRRISEYQTKNNRNVLEAGCAVQVAFDDWSRTAPGG
jgi:hypothetical protein